MYIDFKVSPDNHPISTELQQVRPENNGNDYLEASGRQLVKQNTYM